MTEPQHESTFMHLLRGGVLLAALIAVPGTAVCWNLIPKSFSRYEDINDDTPANTVTLTKPNTLELETATTLPERAQGENDEIKRVDGTEDGTRNSLIPNVFERNSVVPAAWGAEAASKTGAQRLEQETPVSANRNFSSLENRLKGLGARYYRLEKWGSTGELFRFSCYVSAPDPSRYQKHFQAIDSDELRVMEDVIKDIERWKNE